MKASIGDRISVPSRHVGEKVLRGEIIELLRPDGAPPYLVHWLDGHEGIFFPGPEAVIETPEPSSLGARS